MRANILVKRPGQDAPIEAVMQADAMFDGGDLDGRAVWLRVIRGQMGARRRERLVSAVDGGMSRRSAATNQHLLNNWS